MIRLLLSAVTGLTLSTVAVSQDAKWLTKPADPQLQTRTPRYSPVMAGLKRFRVVEPKSWLELNRVAMPQGEKSSMPNMDHGSIPATSHGTTPGMKMDGVKHDMPGMHRPVGRPER